MLAAAGAKTTDMPLTEVRASMQAGKLDVAQNSFELFVSMRFQEFAKSVTVGGHSTLTVFMPVLISKAVWEELSDAERQALEDAAAASDIYFEASQREVPGSGDRRLQQGRRAGAGALVQGLRGLAADRQGWPLEEVQVDQPEDGGPVRLLAAQLHPAASARLQGHGRASGRGPSRPRAGWAA